MVYKLSYLIIIYNNWPHISFFDATDTRKIVNWNFLLDAICNLKNLSKDFWELNGLQFTQEMQCCIPSSNYSRMFPFINRKTKQKQNRKTPKHYSRKAYSFFLIILQNRETMKKPGFNSFRLCFKSTAHKNKGRSKPWSELSGFNMLYVQYVSICYKIKEK